MRKNTKANNTMTWGDLFCGGGGTTSGAYGVPGVEVVWALNHSPSAIATHQANHPNTIHYQSDIMVQDEHDLAPVDGVWASAECLTKDALILTSRGLIPINEVNINDMVLTHKNRWMPVTATMSKMSKTVTIKGCGHPGLETTSNHPMYAIKQGRLWNNARRAYDRIPSEPSWMPASEMKDGDIYRWATPVFIPPLNIPTVGESGECTSRSMDMTDDNFWWIVGRWVADGTIGTGNVEISCGKGKNTVLEMHLFQYIPESDNRRAGDNELRWNIRKLPTADLYYTGFQNLCVWLENNFGKLAYGKKLPGWIYGMPIHSRQAFIDGYLSGDGHIGERRTSLCTVSKELGIGMKILLGTMGYSVCVTYLRKSKTCVIQGRTVNQRDQWVVTFENNKSQRTNMLIDGHSWGLVKSIKDTDNTEMVYNLSVAEDESYVADGIVMHNCTNHSSAKGGKLLDLGSRALPMQLPRYIKHCNPSVVIIENVREFVNWGPLIEGRPDKARKGETFLEWVDAMKACGYPNYEHKFLNAADYGAHTSRLRYFGVFTKEGVDINFPEPTHSKTGSNGLPKWKACREKIDLDNYGVSIWDKNLCPNTITRIGAGLKKYGGDPFILKYYGSNGKDNSSPISSPIGTIPTKDRHAVIQCIARYNESNGNPGANVQAIDDPISSLTTRDKNTLITQFISSCYSGDPATMAHGLDGPIPTLTTSHSQMVITQFLQKYYNSGDNPGSQVQGIDDPAGTIKCSNTIGLVTQIGDTAHSMDSINDQVIDELMYSLTPQERKDIIIKLFGDIRYRFITIQEAKELQGFSPDYKLMGTKTEQLRHIGNAVVPIMAQKLIESNYLTKETHENNSLG